MASDINSRFRRYVMRSNKMDALRRANQNDLQSTAGNRYMRPALRAERTANDLMQELKALNLIPQRKSFKQPDCYFGA